ncbi:MAG: DUF1573 domain-containing protein [Planctomycetaceae bacterium]|jgi:hypothetical protein|nr:DUF1573 domain-containing protein [Planctomycetaceae bacterium]
MKHISNICFIIALLFFVVAGSHLLYRYGKLASTYIWKPHVVCDVTSYNFGRIEKNIDNKYVHEFVIKNNGGAELLIQNVLVGCGSCVAVDDFTKVPIPPKKDGIVRLRLLTDHLSGKISKDVLVQTNDPKLPKLILTLEAEVIRPEMENATKNTKEFNTGVYTQSVSTIP